MSLPSTGIMKKNEKKNMFAREMNRILSLPKNSFQELIEDCKEKGIAQAAKDYSFDPDVLFLAYQNYEEEKTIKKERNKELRENLLFVMFKHLSILIHISNILPVVTMTENYFFIKNIQLLRCKT